MQRLVNRSNYQTDDGEVFEVLTYQDVIDASSKDDPHATIMGMKTLQLASGEKLNYVDENTVKFVHRGQKRLTKV